MMASDKQAGSHYIQLAAVRALSRQGLLGVVTSIENAFASKNRKIHQ